MRLTRRLAVLSGRLVALAGWHGFDRRKLQKCNGPGVNKTHSFEVLIHVMKTHVSKPLATGQLWKTKAADIEILGLGKRLIHYRITKQLGHKRVSAQLCGIEAMTNYLRANMARLAAGPSAN